MSLRHPPRPKATPDPQKIQALFPGNSSDHSVGVSAVTVTFGDDVGIVRIVAIDNAIRYRIGVGAIAVGTDTYLPPGVPEYRAVAPGERLSMIQHSAAAQVNVTEEMGDKV